MKLENDFGKGVCDPIRQSESNGKMGIPDQIRRINHGW